MVVVPWMLIVAAFLVVGSIRSARRRDRWPLRGGDGMPGWNGMSGWMGSQVTGGDAQSDTLRTQLAQEIVSRDAQVEEMHRRLYDLEERLDFTERLLAQRNNVEATPSPR